ncbi:MAG: bifunctional homocysteine S-methyltransferase/methylenetetrahydrofolate reductase [Anaerolineae bacterium]|nr:bifunctional homocysteine S-methyltransferase/methylenetetrahydrofolate reductase [Anaerolineae bacterium]
MVAKTSLLDRLRSGPPLLTDGAMGTTLHQQGVPIDACFDELNLTDPELIARVHAGFLQAGADVLMTNTFGANRFKLGKFGLDDNVAAINRAGVEIAHRAIEAATRKGVYVVGSVGPLGIRLQPYGRVPLDEARAVFAEQVKALADAGVDAILFETFSDRQEILEALAAAQAVAPDVPVIANTSYAADDRTLMGDLPARVARDLYDAGADVIGVNCGGGPSQIGRILQLMRQAVPDALLSAVPNAGYPEYVGGRTMYPATPDYFGDHALTFKAIGANLIGGCCGTSPDHIAAMRAALDDPARPLPVIEVQEVAVEERGEAVARPTELSRKLAAGRFVVTVEMHPPRSTVPQTLLASAQLLQSAGADLVNIADSPTARMKMSPWAVCHLLHTRLGIETVLHFPTRGRNLLRVQGDLLAAHSLGLRNLFVVMGDPTAIGDYPDAMDDYDVTPSGLIQLIKQRMNHGMDQAGNSIGEPTSFTVGCALNMGADRLDREIGVLRKKLAAGADFALAQPVFDPAIIDRFHARYEEKTGEPFTLPVLMGVMPLYSVRHASFLHNEIPGISIPDAIMRRVEDAGDNAPQEGVRIAQELLLAIRAKVQGAYIIPAFGKYARAAEVIEALDDREHA